MSRPLRRGTAEIKQDRVDSTYEEFDEESNRSGNSERVIDIISDPATAQNSPAHKNQLEEEPIENPTNYMLETDSTYEDEDKKRQASSDYSFTKTINGSNESVLIHPEIKSAPVFSNTKRVLFKFAKSAGLSNKDDIERIQPLKIQEKVDDKIIDSPKPWESAIPALLYSNAFTENKGAKEDSSNHQALQDSLIRKDSFKDELDLMKKSLSRSKSLQSKKYHFEPSTDDTPLFFSQTKDGINRSKSLKETRLESKNLDDDSFDKLEDDEDDQSVKYFNNPLTEETELNCFKPKKQDQPKMNKFINLFTPTFKNFYKAEDSALNKISGRNFWNKQTDEIPSLSRKNERTQYVIIWILFVLLMASICTFIPFIIIYSRGTDSSVKNYLSNITPEHRNSLLQDYLVTSSPSSNDLIKPNSPGHTIFVSNKTNNLIPSSNDLENIKVMIPELSSSIAGITKFSQLPEKYRNNYEIQQVFNNTDLKNVFYGVDYAPRNVIYPKCGVTLHDVILDVALLSQVTSRIRTYGTQCNQAKYILDSIKALNLNVALALGVWIGRDKEINKIQMEEMKNLLRSYPREYFESLYIGNEVLFREDQKPNELANYIIEAKKFVVNELGWNLPVGTSELGSKANVEIMTVSDIFGSNTHPFFNGNSVINATNWVYEFVEVNVKPVKEESLKKKSIGSGVEIVISEVGWPYQGGSYNNAVAGKRQMQYFLNNWICESKKTKTPWYFFEAFDEPRKSVYHREGSKWETEWGIFTSERKLKEGIVFPNC